MPSIVTTILVVLIMLIVPRLLMLLVKKVKGFSLLGTVFLCYVTGILLSFVLPSTGIAMTIAELLVPLAIPLILFSCNVVVLKKLARPMLSSFGLHVIAILIFAMLGFFFFRGIIAESGEISSMLASLYIGGTPNLMAIGLSLDVADDLIVLVNSVDLIVGGVYFLLIISVFPRLFGRILPAYRSVELRAGRDDKKIVDQYMPDVQPLTKKNILPLAGAVGLAAICLGISAVVALLTTGSLHAAVIMLGVTTLGVVCSFNKRVRNCRGTYSTGQYLIYMFSIGIGLSFDLSMISAGSLLVVLLMVFINYGGMLLHLLLCRIFKVDVHTMLITSTAGRFGPAFIPSVSSALKNNEILLPGLACGILGYGLANYLGLLIALIVGVL